ncbi:hypothetical protein [Actomonas aquatica]|uniref:AdoMet activation domain-containing protein n=1 Tax=Actomonas aquatica TaxID=2866162 RepID=A0ABZ1C342_9BACT|nr:hypothetical protein [Opitutus sp. WL0086]WRQ85861.1 hypothetical protein K1X11_013695 [Opitutus sp. WL0086]
MPALAPVPETLLTALTIDVPRAEYHRLLGYPPGHEPDERIHALTQQTVAWYATHGQPWIYLREASLDLSNDALHIDGTRFNSPKLLAHLRDAGATRVMLAAVGAGAAIATRSNALWQEGKPDEYFFAEVYGSAVVEHLVASLLGRICDLAEPAGLMAIPHYSPGYAGWDVSEQNRLHDLIRQNQTQPLPEPIEVLSSGMIRPKKTQFGIFGLIPRTPDALATPALKPCQRCAFEPCQYRRAPYQHAPVAIAEPKPVSPTPQYTVARRALRKWADQRLRLDYHDNGTLTATFRFEGSTCSNMGHPLAFDYRIKLGPATDSHRILDTSCEPAPGDTGHTQQCAWLRDPEATQRRIAEPPPVVGQPLDAVLSWPRETRQSGCYCDATSRAHKWGLALETLHYALSETQQNPKS